MKKILPFIFLISVLFFATIGGEFLKPYTSYLVKTFVDKDNPFNFKNEYELLIWQNEQKETIDGLRGTLNLLELEVGDKDIFSQCVINKNIESLTELNTNDSKLNPINPKTVDELSKELSRYQPLMVEIQTTSFTKCTPRAQVETQKNIELSCKCKSVNVHPKSFYYGDPNFNCSSQTVADLKGVIIDFKNERLIYGGLAHPLITDAIYYTGINQYLLAIDILKGGLDQTNISKDEYAFIKTAFFSGIKIERLTGTLDYHEYMGFETDSSLLYDRTPYIPAYSVRRECSLASKL
jgi:hypothetical protein